MRSNLTDIEVILHHETDKAVLVSNDGDREHAVWVPKSQCEIERKGKIWVMTCSEHVATDRGLV